MATIVLAAAKDNAGNYSIRTQCLMMEMHQAQLLISLGYSGDTDTGSGHILQQQAMVLVNYYLAVMEEMEQFHCNAAPTGTAGNNISKFIHMDYYVD